MNKAIQALRYAGLSLEVMRGKTKSERAMIWCMVVATIEWQPHFIVP